MLKLLNLTLLLAYNEVMSQQANDGIIERVTEKESEPPLGRKHYPVIRQDKATKNVRVVFDASCAEGNGLSLNQCLHAGPSFGQSILDILVRFRTHSIALVGDIEKAFLMVRIAERDRNALRFMWYDDLWSKDAAVVIYRFTRVVFGVTSSPFLLNATIKHHLEGYSDFFVDKFLRCIYVDDLVTGAPTIEEGYELCEGQNAIN